MVWWAFRQDPGLSTVAGGAVVMAALLWHLAPDIRALVRPAGAGHLRQITDQDDPMRSANTRGPNDTIVRTTK